MTALYNSTADDKNTIISNASNVLVNDLSRVNSVQDIYDFISLSSDFIADNGSFSIADTATNIENDVSGISTAVMNE